MEHCVVCMDIFRKVRGYINAVIQQMVIAQPILYHTSWGNGKSDISSSAKFWIYGGVCLPQTISPNKYKCEHLKQPPALARPLIRKTNLDHSKEPRANTGYYRIIAKVQGKNPFKYWDV